MDSYSSIRAKLDETSRSLARMAEASAAYKRREQLRKQVADVDTAREDTTASTRPLIMGSLGSFQGQPGVDTAEASNSTRENASTIAMEHLAIAIHFLNLDKDSDREYESLHDWIHGWLGVEHSRDFRSISGSTVAHLSGEGDEHDERDLTAPLRCARDGLKRGYGYKPLAADHVGYAAGVLGIFDVERAWSLGNVARSTRGPPKKKIDRAPKTKRVDGQQQQDHAGSGADDGEGLQ
ncbi:hypothetical protein LTR08_007295 [Meristemomyces frigidus]|nr:hypothetical protein LTR08_007295 [Meristemomyces frigidus]